MKRLLAVSLLLGLSACNRYGVADVTLDAAAAQRNATAAKTLADLQAASDASQGPAPAVHDARSAPAAPRAETPVAATEESPAPPVDDAADADTNG